MVAGVSRFFSRVPEARSLKDSELIDLFVYYLTVEDVYEAATVTLVAACFRACDLTPPARIAPHLSEGVKSRPQRFVKVDGGYKLQRHYRELLSQRLAAGPEQTLDEEVNQSDGLSSDERLLVEAIEGRVPSAAISYRQAITDLQDDKRMSFRGPALELREVLREVLDHIAPDRDVIAVPNFQLEKGRSGPTMKQKVRYILRSRGVGETNAASPEDSANAVDAIIGNLTRSVYNLGSLATHIASERRQVMQVKRYISAVLHDILEIG
jgi:hypothetical protein